MPTLPRFPISNVKDDGGYTERGSLQADHDGHATRFIGSSSGVFFSHTVFNAFSPSIGSGQKPSLSAFDHIFLVKDDDDDDDLENNASSLQSQSVPRSVAPADSWPKDCTGKFSKSLLNIPTSLYALDRSMLPSEDETIECLRKYFKTWHLLFPFLDGKRFISDIKLLFNTEVDDDVNPSNSIVFVATAKAILSIASSISSSPNGERVDDRFKKVALGGASNVTSFLPHIMLASRKDSLGAVQAVIALQLYLISSFRLRTAHQIGGLCTRLAQDAGLHRCPGRYTIFSQVPKYAAIRKRVWYSLTSLDRFISQQLGLLLQIREEDYDVCEPGGEEVHSHSLDRAIIDLPPPQTTPDNGLYNVNQRNNNSEYLQIFQREQVTRSFARLMGLNARAVGMFNQNYEKRKVNTEEVFRLRSDLNDWWNATGLQILSNEQTKGQAVFFRVCFHFTMLNMERPLLTGKPGTAIFSTAIQSAIRFSREIIVDLSKEFQHSNTSSSSSKVLPDKTATLSTLWPGFVHAADVSALVLAYGVRTGELSSSIAIRDISLAINVLEAYGKRWSCVHSHSLAIRVLLSKLKEPEESLKVGEKDDLRMITRKRKAIDNWDEKDKDESAEISFSGVSQTETLPTPFQASNAMNTSNLQSNIGNQVLESMTAFSQDPASSFDPSGTYLSWENFLAETEELLLPLFQ